MNATKANETCNYYGNLLTECVCVFEDWFFIVTSLSIFIHGTDLDDCAHHSKIGHQSKPIAYIRRNKRFSLEYFELSIRIGNIEALATGGFHSKLNDNDSSLSPFLGSSLKNLPEEFMKAVNTPNTNNIYVREGKETVKTNRIMNQYIKNQALVQWGFHSQKFHNDGFYPTNPLDFQPISAYHRATCVLHRTYAMQRSDHVALNRCIADINNMKANMSGMQKKIRSLLHFTKARYNGSFQMSRTELVQKRAELIDIYNRSYSSALAIENSRREMDAKKRYAVKKMSFDDT